MTGVRQRRYGQYLGLILLTWVVLCLGGLREPLGTGWPNELFAYTGTLVVLTGVVFGKPATGSESATWTWLQAAELWLVCGGTALIAGWWDIALLLVIAGGTRLMGRRRAPHVPVPPLSGQWAKAWGEHGSQLSAMVMLLLLLTAFKAATGTGGPKAHRLELGMHGVLISLAGVVWAGRADGAEALASEIRRQLTVRLGSSARLAILALAPFGGFLALAYLVRLPQVASLDHSFVHFAHHRDEHSLRSFMRFVSNAGGEDLAVIWLPLIVVSLAVFRRAHSIRFILAANFGVLGIETIFKALTFRARPDLTHGSHFDSFPSGHTLSAVILAETLLLVLWPANARWGRRLLVAAAIWWPLLMGASRIYLGRHYLTDVIGSWLLGTAWVMIETAVLVAVSSIAPKMPTAIGDSVSASDAPISPRVTLSP